MGAAERTSQAALLVKPSTQPQPQPQPQPLTHVLDGVGHARVLRDGRRVEVHLSHPNQKDAAAPGGGDGRGEGGQHDGPRQRADGLHQSARLHGPGGARWHGPSAHLRRSAGPPPPGSKAARLPLYPCFSSRPPLGCPRQRSRSPAPRQSGWRRGCLAPAPACMYVSRRADKCAFHSHQQRRDEAAGRGRAALRRRQPAHASRQAAGCHPTTPGAPPC